MSMLGVTRKPEAQHHDAPTCDGWWWARMPGLPFGLVYIEERSDDGRKALMLDCKIRFDLDMFDAWIGPLLPPDTTEPAPEVKS